MTQIDNETLRGLVQRLRGYSSDDINDYDWRKLSGIAADTIEALLAKLTATETAHD